MISVILPVYNTKEYLQKCLDSLINQTYKDLEIICIDDGSFDGAEIILDDYSEKDNRVHVVHQENHGESHARNVGLRKSKGEFIAFCDCDDWIEPNMYENLMYASKESNLDMVASGWFKDIYDNNEWISYPVSNIKTVKTEVFCRDQLLRYLYERDSYRGFSYMWNKLYRRSCLSEKNGSIMLFDETLKLGGDVIYLAKAALNVNRTKYIDENFYHYRIRKQSGSHTADMDSFRDWIKAYEITISLYQREGIKQEIIDYLKRFLAYHAYEAAGIAFEKKKLSDYEFFTNVMKEYQEVYERMNRDHFGRVEDYRKRLGLRL